MFLKGFSDQEKNAVLELAHHAAMSDGKFLIQEKELLARFRHELQADASDFPVGRLSFKAATQLVSSPQTRRAIYTELVTVVLVDNEFHPHESTFLTAVREEFGIADDESEKCIAWVKRMLALYAEGCALLGLQPELANA